MATTIKVRPNQSMLDVINMACGSIEAGGQFCQDNNVAISDVPVVGTVYIVSNAALALGDAGTLKYLAQNGIVIGTLGAPASYVYGDEDGDVYVDESGAVYTPE